MSCTGIVKEADDLAGNQENQKFASCFTEIHEAGLRYRSRKSASTPQ